MSKVEEFLTTQEEQEIVEAIQTAEKILLVRLESI